VEEKTPLPLFSKDWGNWAAGKRGIYFVYRDWGVSWHVAFFDYERQDLETLTTVKGNWAWTLPGLSLSPDESALLFTQSDLTNSDIMLIDGFR
jgi:hypothetical protein